MISKNMKSLVRKGEIEKIENYDKAIADKSQTWDCHHRLELTLDGEFAHTRKELKRMGMYYHRPYFELIFLTRAEHTELHSKGRSEETKKKIEKANKYKNCGRCKTVSEESRKKIGEAHIGKHLSEEHKNKLSKPRSDFGKKYFNHFGYNMRDNPKQYIKEHNWYYTHDKKCRWE